MKLITFVAPPFAGHFNPLLVLARAAKDAGYQVQFITGPRKQQILGANRIEALRLESIGPDTLESIANTSDPVGSNPFRLLAQFRQNLRLLPGIAQDLERLWTAAPPDLVVADSVAPIAGLVAEKRNIPWITTIATPFSIENRRGTPAYCGGWTPGDSLATRIRDAAGRTAIHVFKRTVATVFHREFAALGLPQIYRPDGTEAIYSPHAILGFGLRELEFDRDWPPPFEMIGPLIDAPESAPPDITPATRPRVLVTHGTHLLWAKQTLVDEVAALSQALPGVQFVVSLGQPERAGEPPRAAAPRVTVHPFVSYAPQSLGAYDAIIHHGGAGVSYAAILAAIPSLVVPRDYDQFDYAARLVHHRLALRATSIPAAAQSLTRLLDRTQWPALDRFQQYARAYAPQTRFLATVARLIQHGQSAVRDTFEIR